MHYARDAKLACFFCTGYKKFGGIEKAMKTLKESTLPAQLVARGKVRDIYEGKDCIILIATDRISAFDVVLPQQVPYKGQGLNASSAYTFRNSRDIVPNHYVSLPHPNAMVVEHSEPFPVEVVIRGTLSGSAWRAYEKGKRLFFGTTLPDGLRRNQDLVEVLGGPVHTPTSKAERGKHDEDLTSEEVYELVGRQTWEYLEETGTELFRRANDWAELNGYREADTKYEFGRSNGRIKLIDEGNTHDSSRFFKIADYRERFERGEDLDWIDKEFVRNYLKSIGFMGDGPVPDLPAEVIEGASQRVLESVRALTGEEFAPKEPDEEEIIEALRTYKALQAVS